MIIRTRTLLAATRLHEYPPTDIGVRAELEAGNLPERPELSER